MKYLPICMLLSLLVSGCTVVDFEDVEISGDPYFLYDQQGKIKGTVEFKEDGRYVFSKMDFRIALDYYPDYVGYVQEVIGHYVQEGDQLILNDQVRSSVGLINRWGGAVSPRDKLLYENSDKILEQFSSETFTVECRKVILAENRLIEL